MKPNGYTLVEVLIALALSVILFAGLGSVIGQVLETREAVHGKNDLTQQARFAMQQMVRAASRSTRLILPLNDNPNTNWFEHIREETIPPTTPTDDSTRYTAVLAITLDPAIDLDGNGTPDADNDRDGRIDEDPSSQVTNNFAHGLYLIDDNGDGIATGDESAFGDDDEDGSVNEDPVNGLDDDGDGMTDEDPGSDLNTDSKPGIQGVDDDSDGQVDEGFFSWDDDEDGGVDEDWYDPVVFYLVGGTLMQRTPVPWDESGNGFVSGRDFIVEPIAENVTHFRVERIPQAADRAQTVDLTLALTSPVTGETVSLNTRIRVGSAL